MNDLATSAQQLNQLSQDLWDYAQKGTTIYSTDQIINTLNKITNNIVLILRNTRSQQVSKISQAPSQQVLNVLQVPPTDRFTGPQVSFNNYVGPINYTHVTKGDILNFDIYYVKGPVTQGPLSQILNDLSKRDEAGFDIVKPERDNNLTIYFVKNSVLIAQIITLPYNNMPIPPDFNTIKEGLIIHRVDTNPQYQGKGLCTLMVTLLIDWTKKNIYRLSNEGGKAGCICYIRAFTSRGYTSYHNLKEIVTVDNCMDEDYPRGDLTFVLE